MLLDAAVLEFLRGNNSLLDSKILSFQACLSVARGIEIGIVLLGRKTAEYSSVEINFFDVLEFELLCEQEDQLSDIWDLKFLQLPDGTFYISLDPDPETLESAGVADLVQSETDHFFVRARHLNAVPIPK